MAGGRASASPRVHRLGPRSARAVAGVRDADSKKLMLLAGDEVRGACSRL
jgi:hypothetical protein